MKNLFLTGDIEVGKSTILKKILEKINMTMGGYITEKHIRDNTKTFIVKSLYNCVENHTIAKVNTKKRSKEVFLDSFESKLPSILDNSLKNRDLIVLDELGFMENHVGEFTSKVYEILDSKKPAFGVIKDFDCEFLNTIRNREDVIVVEITKNNRDFILEKITSILKDFGVKFKKETSFTWNQKRIDLYNRALDHPETAYPHAFIKEIKKYTGTLKGKKVLDIGAGTGAFALPLMKEGACITAIDSSYNMLSSLSRRAQEKDLRNYNCIIGPFEKARPGKHDIGISAFSASSTKTLEGIKKMHDLVREYAFIIASFENQKYNFKRNILYEMLNRHPKKRKGPNMTLENTLDLLNNNGYSYEHKKIQYDFSQYFNDFHEALDFFKDRYDIRSSKEIEITKEFLNRFLVKSGIQYRFENIKESTLICIK